MKEQKPQVLAKFDFDKMAKRIGNSTQKGEKTVKGEKIEFRLNEARLICLAKNPKCVECHKEGKQWRLERLPGQGAHLNLYSDDGILLTRDHIVPRARFFEVYGTTEGIDSLSNSQTMCYDCNNKKQHKLAHETEVPLTANNRSVVAMRYLFNNASQWTGPLAESIAAIAKVSPEQRFLLMEVKDGELLHIECCTQEQCMEKLEAHWAGQMDTHLTCIDLGGLKPSPVEVKATFEMKVK